MVKRMEYKTAPSFESLSRARIEVDLVTFKASSMCEPSISIARLNSTTCYTELWIDYPVAVINSLRVQNQEGVSTHLKSLFG